MLRATPGTAGHRTTLRGHRGAARRLVLAQASGREGVKAVIEGLSALGPLRFICIGDGGILEVAQKFDQCAAPRGAISLVRREHRPASLQYCAFVLQKCSARQADKDVAVACQEGHRLSLGTVRLCHRAPALRRVSYNDIPNKGTYCTLKTDDRGFEAHIALDKVRSWVRRLRLSRF